MFIIEVNNLVKTYKITQEDGLIGYMYSRKEIFNFLLISKKKNGNIIKVTYQN